MIKLMTLVLMTACLTSYGQIQDSIKYDGKMVPIEPRIETLAEPLFVISLDQQTIQIRQNDLFKDSVSIKPEWILSMNVLKVQDAIAKYGERGKYGAVLIDLKKESLDLLPPEMKRKLTTYKIESQN